MMNFPEDRTRVPFVECEREADGKKIQHPEDEWCEICLKRVLGMDRENCRYLLEWSPYAHPLPHTVEHHPLREMYLDRDEEEALEEMVRRDRQAPFFTEAYLYTLLGKDDARTLLAVMRPILERAEQVLAREETD